MHQEMPADIFMLQAIEKIHRLKTTLYVLSLKKWALGNDPFKLLAETMISYAKS